MYDSYDDGQDDFYSEYKIGFEELNLFDSETLSEKEISNPISSNLLFAICFASLEIRDILFDGEITLTSSPAFNLSGIIIKLKSK